MGPICDNCSITIWLQHKLDSQKNLSGRSIQYEQFGTEAKFSSYAIKIKKYGLARDVINLIRKGMYHFKESAQLKRYVKINPIGIPGFH